MQVPLYDPKSPQLVLTLAVTLGNGPQRNSQGSACVPCPHHSGNENDAEGKAHERAMPSSARPGDGAGWSCFPQALPTPEEKAAAGVGSVWRWRPCHGCTRGPSVV